MIKIIIYYKIVKKNSYLKIKYIIIKYITYNIKILFNLFL